jgi:hypothetical protein
VLSFFRHDVGFCSAAILAAIDRDVLIAATSASRRNNEFFRYQGSIVDAKIEVCVRGTIQSDYD